MKVAQMLDQRFFNSLARLKSVRPESLAAAVKIKKIHKRIIDEMNIFEDARLDALKELAEKNEAGEPKTNEHNEYVLSRENQMVMATKMNEIANIEIEIETINITELGDLTKIKGLSPDDLDILAPILIVE